MDGTSQPIGASFMQYVFPASLSHVSGRCKPDAGDSGHTVSYSMSVVLYVVQHEQLRYPRMEFQTEIVYLAYGRVTTVSTLLLY